MADEQDAIEIQHEMEYVDGEAAYRRPDDWPIPREPPLASIVRDLFKFRLTFDRVLVLEVRQEKTEGGIIIPEQAQETNKDYRVWIIRVGPAAFAQGFREGDRCRMNQYGGVKVQLQLGQAKGTELHLGIVKVDDLMCFDDMDDQEEEG